MENEKENKTTYMPGKLFPENITDEDKRLHQSNVASSTTWITI